MRRRSTELRLILLGLLAGVVLWVGLSRLGAFVVAQFPATRDLRIGELVDWMLMPRFFVKDGDHYVSNHPFMSRQRFSSDKPPGEFRVFLVGESQAMGTPYVQMQSELGKLNRYMRQAAADGGIATWLHEYLQELNPDRQVQVVNAAVASQNITSAAASFEQIAEIGNPDLVVVLAGNGESYNIRYQSLAELDQALGRLSDNFARQLARIVGTATVHEIPTYVLTVPTNLRDWLPYYAVDAPTYRLVAEGQWSLVNAALLAGVEANEALRHYLRGKAKDADGDPQERVEAYLLAKDLDFNLIRAHSRLNDLIRGTGSAFVKVFDLEVALRQYAEGGVPGFELLHDYCHLTLRGNVLAARELALFHQQVTGAAPRSLPVLDPREHLQRKLRGIYKLELRRWTKLASTDIPMLVDVNAIRMEEQFRQLSEELESSSLSE